MPSVDIISKYLLSIFAETALIISRLRFSVERFISEADIAYVLRYS